MALAARAASAMSRTPWCRIVGGVQLSVLELVRCVHRQSSSGIGSVDTPARGRPHREGVMSTETARPVLPRGSAVRYLLAEVVDSRLHAPWRATHQSCSVHRETRRSDAFLRWTTAPTREAPQRAVPSNRAEHGSRGRHRPRSGGLQRQYFVGERGATGRHDPGRGRRGRELGRPRATDGAEGLQRRR